MSNYCGSGNVKHTDFESTKATGRTSNKVVIVVKVVQPYTAPTHTPTSRLDNKNVDRRNAAWKAWVAAR